MKLALVCPHFPPDVCGVGDYTSLLSGELARQGHTPRVWTAQLRPERVPGVELRGAPYPWKTATFRLITEEISAWKPDAVVVQFTPNLYGPASLGLNAALLPFLGRLRRAVRRPVVLTPHELHHPIGFKPGRLLLGTPQLLQFLNLALGADLVLFTYEIPCRRYQRLLPWKRDRLFWLPVGANVLPPAGYARRPREKGAARILLQFGSPHPSRLFDFTVAALDRAMGQTDGKNSELKPPRLLMVGTTPAMVRDELMKLDRLDLLPSVEGLGYLEAARVSDWMSQADLVLAPYYDGISARRGSVMAALAHGIPVVTTRGYHTDPSVRWEEFCGIAPATDPAAFAQVTTELLAAPAQANALGEAGRARFEKDFSWSTIARELVEHLEPLETGARR